MISYFKCLFLYFIFELGNKIIMSSVCVCVGKNRPTVLGNALVYNLQNRECSTYTFIYYILRSSSSVDLIFYFLFKLLIRVSVL